MGNQKLIIFMKNILSNEWKYKNKILYLSILLSFIIIAYYILRSGFSMSSDSERFSRWADTLISLNFNLFEFFSIDKVAHRPSLFFFSIPVILIALCKVIFVNEWQFFFLLFNLLLIFFSLIIFTKTLLLIDVRSILISITLPLVVISVDILTWPQFILSDMIYAFLILLSTYFILKGIIKNKFNYFEIFIIIFLLLASRPSSIPVVFMIFSYIVIFRFNIFNEAKFSFLLLFLLFILTPFIYAAIYFYIEFYIHGIAKLDFVTGMVKSGMIIHDRPETWVPQPNNYLDVVCIYFLRIINFFNPYAATFSILHVFLNVIQTCIFLFSIIIWLYFIGYIKSYDKIFFFIISLSFSVAAFHSFILIDYDWRYRFPILLPLMMLFPISLEIIIKKKLNLKI